AGTQPERRLRGRTRLRVASPSSASANFKEQTWDVTNALNPGGLGAGPQFRLCSFLSGTVSQTRLLLSSKFDLTLLFRQKPYIRHQLRHDLAFRQSGFAFTKRPRGPWGSRAYPCVDERTCLVWGSR